MEGSSARGADTLAAAYALLAEDDQRVARQRRAVALAEVAQAREAIARVDASLAWRLGHRLTSGVGRARRRPDSTAGGVAAAADHLERVAATVAPGGSPARTVTAPGMTPVRPGVSVLVVGDVAPALVLPPAGPGRQLLVAGAAEVPGAVRIPLPAGATPEVARRLGAARAEHAVLIVVRPGASEVDVPALAAAIEAGARVAFADGDPQSAAFALARDGLPVAADPLHHAAVLAHREPAARPVPRDASAGAVPSEVAAPARAAHRLRALAATGPDAALGRATFALLVAGPDPERAARGGDWHLAEGLARALRAGGHRARLLARDGWDRPGATAGDDVVVVVRGRRPVPLDPGPVNVLWLISHPEDVGAAELDAYDLVCVASERHAERLRPLTGTPVTSLLQATDPARFTPAAAGPGTSAAEVLWVGHRHTGRRRAVEDLPPALLARTCVIGHGWEGALPSAPAAVVPHVPYDELPARYAAAQVVLCDHWPDMRAAGFLNNRVLDVLASGTAVVVDDVAGAPPELLEVVERYDAATGPAAAIERVLAEPARREERAAAGRAAVVGRHDLETRAAELLAALSAAPEHLGLVR